MSNTNNSNTALQTFTFEDTRIRAGLDDNEPWFVAKDIATVLGYSLAPHMTRMLDSDELSIHLVDTNKGPRKMTTITEAGLYRIILKREAAYVKDPAARAMVTRFQWWVTHEVLPSLRKTGSYTLPASAPSLSGKALLAAAVLEAQKTIDSLEKENRELKPKAAYADAVGAAENTLTMPQMAKILSSHGFPGGVVKLYRKLREDHVVYRKHGRNLPCQRYVDAGLFTARISPYEAKGHHYNGVTMLVTPKGSRWLAARYCPTAAGASALEKSDTPVLDAPVVLTWQNACFVEEERGYQGEGYPILHVFNNQAEAEDWTATHDGRPVDRKQGKQEAEDIAGLRVEALGWTWDGSLEGLRALPAADDAKFAQAVADVYALDAGPWTGNIVFHC